MEAFLVTLVAIGIGASFAAPPLLVTLRRRFRLSLKVSVSVAFILWSASTAFLLAWGSGSPDYKVTTYFAAGMYFVPSLFWLLMAWLFGAQSNAMSELERQSRRRSS